MMYQGKRMPPDAHGVHPAIERWLAARDWAAFDFQRETWRAIAAGRCGLLHATTGSGKTYAVWLGLLSRALQEVPVAASSAHRSRGDTHKSTRRRKADAFAPLRVLWITPMRALAADTVRALEAPLDELGIAWSVGARTGDTSAAERARQSRRLPTALVTTPESLSLLMTRDDACDVLS